MAIGRDRTKIQRRVGSLRTERVSFITHWRDLAQFVAPRRGRFETTDRNRGNKPYGSIVNGKATWSLRESAAGLFTGTMSPARPWHWLRPAGDPGLNEFAPVRQWLHDVAVQQREIFRRSNLYSMAHLMLKDLILFGTGCMSHESDPNTVARFYTEPVGSYMLGQDGRYRVNTVVREKELTCEQIMGRWGNKASTGVRHAYDRGDYDKAFEVTHYVGPNPDYEPGNPMALKKRWLSLYFEPGNLQNEGFLSEGGFEVFPFYVPRWEVTGNDTYATACPGMEALGDIRSLQTQERVKARAVAKMADPPLHGPPSLRNVPVNALPGGTTIYDTTGSAQGKGLQPVYMVDPKVGELNLDIARTEERIDKAFFVELFRAISSMEGVQPRNQLELTQRNQEALLQLGPALQRLHQDFFEHLIDRTFNQQIEAGMLPPPPPELEGQELEVHFVSALAMAQQAVSTGNIERLSGFAAGLAGSGFPDAVDKFDADQAVDLMAELIGAPPELVRSDDDVAEMRKQRAEAQEEERQAMIQAEQAKAVGTQAQAVSALGNAG